MILISKFSLLCMSHFINCLSRCKCRAQSYFSCLPITYISIIYEKFKNFPTCLDPGSIRTVLSALVLKQILTKKISNKVRQKLVVLCYFFLVSSQVTGTSYFTLKQSVSTRMRHVLHIKLHVHTLNNQECTPLIESPSNT